MPTSVSCSQPSEGQPRVRDGSSRCGGGGGPAAQGHQGDPRAPPGCPAPAGPPHRAPLATPPGPPAPAATGAGRGSASHRGAPVRCHLKGHPWRLTWHQKTTSSGIMHRLRVGGTLAAHQPCIGAMLAICLQHIGGMSTMRQQRVADMSTVRLMHVDGTSVPCRLLICGMLATCRQYAYCASTAFLLRISGILVECWHIGGMSVAH